MNALKCTAAKNNALHAKMAKRMYTVTSSTCHSYRPSSPEASRAFPQYTVYTPTCLLQVKPTPPTFKKAGLDGIAIDKPGRMLLEFIPAKKQQQYDSAKVSYDYNAPTKGMLSLSVEEIGTFLAKTTGENKRIEIRRGGGSEYNSNNVASADEYDTQGIAVAVRQTEKTLTILPEESGHFNFNFAVRSNADEAPIIVSQKVIIKEFSAFLISAALSNFLAVTLF